MWFTICLSLTLLLSACRSDVTKAQCGYEFHGQCFCGLIEKSEHFEFLVNCTNTGFTNTSILEKLPSQTERLIFNGNNIPILPWNVFGSQDNTPKLKVVDMSNNHIEEIRGKSYHHVASVELLYLNHNELSLAGTEDHRHPRMFSNFVNLKALHLTNAFKDNSPANMVNDLHDIFINSNLSQLIKLHLEQNELTGFTDRMIFCDLPSLMDLHLADNLLRGVDFNLTCLTHLRYLDLRRNKIARLSRSDLNMLDALPARGQNLTINLSDNPFCDCTLLYEWLATTKVKVENKDNLKCNDGSDKSRGSESQHALHHVSCTSLLRPRLKSPESREMSTGAAVTITLLSTAIIFLLGVLLYMKRDHLPYRFSPLLDTVSRKVQYTTIGRSDDQEVDV